MNTWLIVYSYFEIKISKPDKILQPIHLPISVTATPECFRHEDCRNSEVCHTGSCINACIVKDCADNAICSTTVHDIACKCRPGFTGDGHVRCSLCKY